MGYRKSKLMRSVEAREKEPLEILLPAMINQHGFTATASRLEINKATLGYWLLKMGITVHRVAVRPGESLEVRGAPAEAD